jgi:hypothetical protein
LGGYLSNLAIWRVPTRETDHSALSRTARLLALYVAVSAVTRLVVVGTDVVNVDESSYVVGAWELLHGRLAYTGFADNKPPLIYAYYALTQLFGHGIVSVRLITTLVTVPFTALAASAFYGHDRRGIVAGLAFLVFSAAYDAGEMLAVNCELVMLLPLTWALVLVRHSDLEKRYSRALVVGILIGIATLV